MSGVAARIREAGGVERARPVAGSVADQAFVSLTHFMVNLALANWLAAAQYGMFAIAFAILAIAFELQNSLYLLPMAVLGMTTYRDTERQYLAKLWRLHWLCAAACAGMLLAAAAVTRGEVMGECLSALAAGLPLILAMNLVRRICQLKGRQVLCAGGSFIYLVVTGAALILLRQRGFLSPATAILTLGAGAAASSLLVWMVVTGERGRHAAVGPRIGLASVAREHLKMARWSLSSSMATAGMAQGLIFLAGAAQGAPGAASIRAAVTLVMPLGQFVTAMQTHFLPKLAREHNDDRRRWRSTGRMLTFCLGAGSAVYAAAVTLSREELYRLIYGGKYAETPVLLPLLALACVPASVSAVQQLILMSKKNYREAFEVAGSGAAIGLPLVVAGAYTLGLPGLALGSIAGYAAAALRGMYLTRRSA